MGGLMRWLGGILLGLTGLIGLYISANAHDSGFSFFGLLLSLFSIFMLFRLIVFVTETEGNHP
jgi:hypothetical protein